MSDTKSLAGRVALVTGGSTGMGFAHAHLLASRGAKVAITDFRQDALEIAQAKFTADGLELTTLKADNCSVGDIEAAVARHGHIDILVNNAGVSGFSKSIEDIDEESFDRMFDTHVKGAFFYTRSVLPAMKEARWGRIINISSNFAMTGFGSMSHYVGAKGALLGLTKAWAREFAPFGITVNAVAPGLIETPMTVQSIGNESLAARAHDVPLGRLASAQEIAFAVGWLASEEAAMMTGQVVSPNGGMSIVGI
jgi:3-oxoacyl-[acyl-carrier protein] reductase